MSGQSYQSKLFFGLITSRLLYFRKGLHNAVERKRISYLLGNSSDDSNFSRIIKLSARGNGVLEERTLTDFPKIESCRMIRVASKSPLTELPLYVTMITLVVRNR